MSLLLSVLLLLFASPARAVDTPVDVLPEDLQEVFVNAEAAWQAGRMEEAYSLYRQVIDAQPDFDRAWRRACGVRVQQHQYTQAVDLCREAESRNASIENRTGLAIALIHGGTDPDEARDLVDEVTSEDPSYLAGQQALCSYALENEDTERLRRCVVALKANTPDAPAVPLFQGLLDAHEGRFDDAWRQIEIAAGIGVPADMLGAIRARVGARQARAPVARKEAGPWSLTDFIPVGIVLLLIAGIALLALSDREEPDDEGDRS